MNLDENTTEDEKSSSAGNTGYIVNWDGKEKLIGDIVTKYSSSEDSLL